MHRSSRKRRRNRRDNDSRTSPGQRLNASSHTGISTLRALQPASDTLAAEHGILLRYTNLEAKLEPTMKGVMQQPGGTHADEIETSMMLYIDASSVDMTKAVRDYTPVPPSSVLRLTRQRGRAGTYSSTGIWGDPTFASATKGRMLVEALVAGILDDITQLRTAPLPARSNTPPQTQNTNRPANQPPVPQSPGIECTPGDFRDIRAVGEAFTSAWNQKDRAKVRLRSS